VAEFFAVPEENHRRETRIGRDELLLSVLLPPLPAGTRTLYLKAMDRKVWAFALVSVAEQELLGAEVGDELFARAADAALSGAELLRHNAYKVPLAKTLIRRALTILTTP